MVTRAADASAGVEAVADQVHTVVRDTPVQPSRPSSRLHGVPLPSQSFVGRRQELDQLCFTGYKSGPVADMNLPRRVVGHR